jgi:hypothetical protein
MGKHTNYFMRKLLDIAGFSWYLHVIFHSQVDKPFGMFFFFPIPAIPSIPMYPSKIPGCGPENREFYQHSP